MEFFNNLMLEINAIDFDDFIVASLFVIVPFYFSKKAQTLFFHLLYSVIGIYMIFTMSSDRILLDVKMLVGIGLLLPQIGFIIYFVKDTIQTIKMMTANTYYFFITIYYKLLRLINWIKNIPLNIKIFFETFGFKKQNNEYKEKQNFEEENSFHEKESSFKEEEQHYYEEPKQEEQSTNSEYDRFHSNDPYTVLGVNLDEDFSTIKKAYIKLINIYHPDLNPDSIEYATEMAQLINGAYAKIKKSRK